MNNKKINLYFLLEKYYNESINNKGKINMMKILNVDVSIFGNFGSIQPSQENIIGVMSDITFIKVLPKMALNQNIDINSKKITSEMRLGFISEDEKYQIAILPNRINVVGNVCNIDDQEKTCNMQELNKVISTCTSIMEVIVKRFSVIGNRLAVNLNVVSPDVSLEEINDYYKNMFLVRNTDKDSKVYEWSSSTNVRKHLSIDCLEEEINVINNCQVIYNEAFEKRKILFNIDINTLPERVDYRFSLNHILNFVRNVSNLIEDSLNHFKEVIANG